MHTVTQKQTIRLINVKSINTMKDLYLYKVHIVYYIFMYYQIHIYSGNEFSIADELSSRKLIAEHSLDFIVKKI